jgi:DNA-binding beta-propeller fold protein YncE
MKFLATATLAVCLATMLNGQSSTYKLESKVLLPGGGGWDYVTVDAAGRRVYVSHATHVDVMDADSLKPIGTIDGTPGVHGIAVAPEVGRGFITAGGEGKVVIFDLKSLKTIAEVSVGKKPDAIAFDPASNRVFAMNGGSESATAINVADGTIAGTIDLGGGLEATVADGKGNVWVNLEDQSLLVRIDSKTMKILNRWPVAPCASPSSLALDAQNRRLFVGCRNHVMAVADADTGRIVAHYPIGDHVDTTAFDPETKLVFSSLGEGSIAVFRQDTPDSYTALDGIPTATGAKTMGLDLKNHRLFVPSLSSGEFHVLVFDRL